jgi:hypothetical protein
MTDASTAIAAGPIVEALQPFITAVVTTVVGAFAAIALTTWNRWLGIKTTSDQKDAISKAAATEAGVLVAEASDNLAGRSINVANPAVAAAASRVAAAVPAAIAATGITPADVARVVTGEIGKLQAQSATNTTTISKN